MSFKVIERSSPCQHLREYPQATSTFQEECLHLSAKQYIPLNYTPQPGDVTILAGHASGMPKELYEPLWEDLLQQSKKAGYGIRSIWMADVANQGGSYLLNEEKTGNEVNFADHSRDLLALINNFREEFPRPIIGVGHSMGCASLISLSHMHPRLLTSIVNIDAIIHTNPLPKGAWYLMARLPSYRRDLWKSRREAEAAFRKNAMLQKFDSRVMDKILAHSLRPLPTLLYPDAPSDGKEKAYTLTTPKHQEAFAMARPNYRDVTVVSKPDAVDKQLYADIWDDVPDKSPFYKSEGRTCWMFLPHVRPSMFWLYGAESYSADPEERAYKLERTGTGWNGSGGAALGRVKEDVVEGTGHWLCFEKVKECAVSISRYIDGEMKIWREAEERSIDPEWRKMDIIGRQKMDDTWLAEVKQWKGQRQVLSKL